MTSGTDGVNPDSIGASPSPTFKTASSQSWHPLRKPLPQRCAGRFSLPVGRSAERACEGDSMDPTMRTVVAVFAMTTAAALPGRLSAQETQGARTIVLSLADALNIAAGESETVWVAEAGVMRAMGN